mgnify:CR=1 FL=1
MAYVILDTNVLVSALLSKHDDAATVKVMQKLFEGKLVPVYSTLIVQEYIDVLHRKKFKFDPDLVNAIIEYIQSIGIKIVPGSVQITLPDAKDLPFYEVFYCTRDINSYLVTGNLKHFPVEPFIVSAADLIRILES